MRFDWNFLSFAIDSLLCKEHENIIFENIGLVSCYKSSKLESLFGIAEKVLHITFLNFFMYSYIEY